MTDDSSQAVAQYYRCIHCLTPCSSLYRELSPNTAVKLSPCVSCHENVDPYVEREWLLVILDLILLRIEAYRHVLFHRLKGERRWVLLLLAATAASFLAATMMSQESSTHRTILQLTLRNLVGFYTMLLVCGLILRFHSTIEWTLLHVALLLPMSFHAVTLAVTIWEDDSQTVQQLASLLIFIYQAMAVQAIILTDTTILVTVMTLGLAVAVKAALVATVDVVLQLGQVPCAGIEFRIQEWTLCFTS